MSPAEAAERLLFVSNTLNDSQADVEAVAKVIEDTAKNALGSVTNPADLAPLAPSTAARKGSDLIGLETGELKKSISTTIGDREAWIGTNMDRGVYLENGTSRQPPRPIYPYAAKAGLDALVGRTHERVKNAFEGRRRSHGYSDFFHELDHARHAWKHLFEAAKTFVGR